MKRTCGAFLLVCACAMARGGAGERPLVALVFSEASHKSSPQGEGRGAKTFLKNVAAALTSAGVEFARLNDSDAAAGRLAPFKMALFPYSFVWPKPLVAGVKQYVEGGGKAFFFYTMPHELGELIGVKTGPWESKEPRYAAIKLRQDLLIPGGLPPRVRQNSHNIYRVEPAVEDADVLGEWLGPDGEPFGGPALVVTRRGAFMGHVLAAGDVANKGQMLRAVIGLLVPEIGERAHRRALADAEKVGPLGSFDALAARIETARVSRSNRRKARAQLAQARRSLEAVRSLADGSASPPPTRGELGDDPALRPFRRSFAYADALNSVAEAREAAKEAFVLSSAERRDEFRATWIHTAYGVGDWGWRKSIRHLRDNGFNAIIPNMLWAGLAHYPSEILPVSPKVAEKGDQIAECLRWCKRYGVELHVWKVNYNLSTAPKAFVEKLRAEGRLQRHRNGTELKWLCPSDRRNFVLERESMLEVVRNYAVDGIHFDYIRYPGAHSCFCDGCRERFGEAVEARVEKCPADVFREPLKPLFTKWRQDQITRLVHAVATEARRIRPGVMVSAAVFGAWEGARFSVGQDWRLWVERGYLDFVCPMDYTTSADRLAGLVARQVGWVRGLCLLYPGLGAWRIGDAPALLDQLERARGLGADGFVCFHYNDRTFTGQRLPALRLSHTAHRARPPHPSPQARFDLPPGIPELPGLGYPQGEEMEFAVTLYKDAHYAKRPRRVSGRLSIETTEGEQVRRLSRVREREKLTASATLPPGRYRLVVRGRASFGWFRGRGFVVRSRPFEVVGTARAEAEAAKRLPPKFRTAGLRVGVVAGGYGSEALLGVLRRQIGIEALLLQRLTADYLKPCQVVVFPQPRESRSTKPEAVEALRAFVAAGGGLLATHDAPGYRTHPVLIPEVCPGGTARIEGTSWWATTQHPVTAGFTAGRATSHSYYDFIALRVGPKGKAVAEGISGKGGRAPSSGPAVVCGELGPGRYVACGLALGIDRKDADRTPTGAELALLLNAVRWLGRQ